MKGYNIDYQSSANAENVSIPVCVKDIFKDFYTQY